MELKILLSKLVMLDGSDLFLSTAAPPCARVMGKLIPLDLPALQKGEVKTLAYSIMDKERIAEFERNLEMNLAISESGIGRFRVNIFVQRAEVGMVIRRIHTVIPSLESLGLPLILKDVIMEKRGLVLFVGATGSGKSTSLASLINYRNENHAGHICTIEDPIEYVHKHKKSIVDQREVGIDTLSYEEALKNTLRQSPDLILIGEIRSQETMEHAIVFAETGHLCLSTLHANNANQALDRIINFFPEEKRPQLLLDLSFNVRAIISQRLVSTIDGKRTAAVEVLLGSPLILSLIHRGELSAIKQTMEKSTNLGMQTFDQALENLYFEGKISYEEAIRNADSKNNLRLKIKLRGQTPKLGDQTTPAIPLESDGSDKKDPLDDSDTPGLRIVDDN